MNGICVTTGTEFLADQILSTNPSSIAGDSGAAWTGDAQPHFTVELIDNRPIRLRVLEFVLLNPGLDAEEIADALQLPFAEVSDEVADMCAAGLLSPE